MSLLRRRLGSSDLCSLSMVVGEALRVHARAARALAVSPSHVVGVPPGAVRPSLARHTWTRLATLFRLQSVALATCPLFCSTRAKHVAGVSAGASGGDRSQPTIKPTPTVLRVRYQLQVAKAQACAVPTNVIQVEALSHGAMGLDPVPAMHKRTGRAGFCSAAAKLAIAKAVHGPHPDPARAEIGPRVARGAVLVHERPESRCSERHRRLPIIPLVALDGPCVT